MQAQPASSEGQKQPMLQGKERHLRPVLGGLARNLHAT
jgi:hypothetical protein